MKLRLSTRKSMLYTWYTPSFKGFAVNRCSYTSWMNYYKYFYIAIYCASDYVKECWLITPSLDTEGPPPLRCTHDLSLPLHYIIPFDTITSHSYWFFFYCTAILAITKIYRYLLTFSFRHFIFVQIVPCVSRKWFTTWSNLF